MRQLIPLSSLQRTMVRASLRAPHLGIYVIQDVCTVTEELDPVLLKRAWQTVAGRHAALRSRIIKTSDGELWMERLERPEAQWTEVEWSADLDVFLRADRERGFDFTAGVPLRFALLKTGARAYELVWTCHHVLLDGRSLEIVWREWFAVYDGLIDGRGAALPEAPDVGEHAMRRQALDKDAARSYWGEYLAAVEPGSGSLTDRLKPAGREPGEEFARETVTLSAGATDDVRAFGEEHGLTVNTLVQGAWALLLSRYLGRRNVTFGATRACRYSSVEQARGMAGVLINTVPVRIEAQPDARVVAWLREIRDQWIRMRAYEQTPFEAIHEASGLAAGEPLFETVVVYDREPVTETLGRLDGWQQRRVVRHQRTDSPLTVAAYGQPVLRADLVYDTRLFQQVTVAAMARHLTTLLEEFVRKPEGRLSSLRMLTESEQRRVVELSRGPGVLYPRELCAHRLFERQARRTPGKSALEYRGTSINYRELNQRANQFARFLRDRDVGPEDVVTVRLERTPEAVTALLGVLKAGAVFLPIGLDVPEERLANIIEDARPKLLLDELPREMEAQPAEDLADGATSENAAYAVYTSGSSGKPKGVVVTHRALVNHTLGAIQSFDISEADRRFQFAPMGADVFIAEAMNYLCSGATLVFCPGRHSVQEYSRLLEEHGITITAFTGSWWTEWVAALSRGELEIPRSLRAVIVGMEQVNAGAFQTWKRLCGGRVRWFNAYGPSEATPTSTIYEAGTSAWENEKYVPIGTPLANTQVQVLDNERNLVPDGVAGEFYISGEGLARGYLGAPELTAEKFVLGSNESGGRFYRTGDAGFRLPDGNLVFLGRSDRQVKIRGHRVELEEIESALGQHAGVRQCAVVTQGEPGSERLAAYFVRVGDPLSVADLRRHLAARLPLYMMPSAYVELEGMPMTASGKIDRKSLPAVAAGPVAPGGEILGASTETEKRLAVLWREVLGAEARNVLENFFDAGGDSLRATRLIGEIAREFGREFPLAALFQAPTIARLGALLDEGGAGCVEHAAVGLKPRGSGTPLYCVSAAAGDPYRFRDLAKYIEADQPFFAIPMPVEDREQGVTVEQLAGRVCQAVRRVHACGPYILGGYCFGGVVAFEAARQFLAEGADIRLVVLFETPAPGYPKLARAGGRYVQELRKGGITGRAVLEHVGVIRRLLTAKALRGLQQVGKPPRIALESTAGAEVETTVQAARMYVPKPVGAPVLQFIAERDEVSSRVLEDPRLGWRDVAEGGFEVYRVNGYHGDLLGAETAGEVARVLGERVAAARSRVSGQR